MVEGLVNGLLIIGALVWFLGAVGLAVTELAAAHPIYGADESTKEFIASPFGRALTRYSPWTALAWPIVAAVMLMGLALGMFPDEDEEETRGG